MAGRELVSDAESSFCDVWTTEQPPELSAAAPQYLFVTRYSGGEPEPV